MNRAYSLFRFPQNARELLFPLVVLASIAIILVPLPAAMMDMLLSLNLTFSVLLLLTVMFLRNPLEMSAFPAVLLSATMFRLGLNIATTRLILSNAQEQGDAAAGQVILTFSNFVASGNLVVGAVIFLIVILIQFLVITKGATRISEVSARFTLDGLPGKQMAIDAELHSGAISSEEAVQRRAELMDQVDFYGAMDGASKFVRGDAIAGMCITLVNILGGFCIGLSSGTMSLNEVATVYTRLTIGDGLVSQLPAFLVALSAAMLVTRGSRPHNLPDDVVRQTFSKPLALFLTAVFLGLLVFTHLPKIPLCTLGIFCIWGAWYLESSRRRAEQSRAEADAAQLAEASKQVPMSQWLILDSVELEWGSGLADWVQDSENLLEKVRLVRRLLAEELGVLLPNVRISSNAALGATQYRILIHGASVAEYLLRPDSLLAVEGGLVSGIPEGLKTYEPVHRTSAVWIAPSQRTEAESFGYRVWTPQEIVMEHLAETARAFAPELLSRMATQSLLDELKPLAPGVVESLIPEVLSVSEVQRVLQALLAERVSIRPLARILESLGEHAQQTHNPVRLADFARVALGRNITSPCLDTDGSLHVLTLSPSLEARFRDGFTYTEEGMEIRLLPQDCETLCHLFERYDARLSLEGRRGVVLVPGEIRSVVRRTLAERVPLLPILALNEVPAGTRLEYLDMVDA